MYRTVEPVEVAYYLCYVPFLLLPLIIMLSDAWSSPSSIVFFLGVEWILYSVLSNKQELFDVYGIRDLYRLEEEKEEE